MLLSNHLRNDTVLTAASPTSNRILLQSNYFKPEREGFVDDPSGIACIVVRFDSGMDSCRLLLITPS